jgi:integrase/recombinase XerC
MHGLRFSEAIIVGDQNWDREKHTITFRKKGGDDLTLPISAEAEELFQLAPQGQPGESYLSRLIPSRVHHGNVKNRVQWHWTQQRAKAGVTPDLHAHDLRRTCAVTMYELTHDLRAVQAVLGHSNIGTTGWYLMHRDTEKIRAILAQVWHPTPKAVQ